MAIGQMKDDPARLEAAANYLRKANGNHNTSSASID
jgi:hypothetical protein